MWKPFSSVGAVFLATFLALSVRGTAGPSGAGNHALLASDNHGAQTERPSAANRNLEPGHAARHDSPPSAPLSGPARLPHFRFSEILQAHPAGPGQLRPASLDFSLYPTGPPVRR